MSDETYIRKMMAQQEIRIKNLNAYVKKGVVIVDPLTTFIAKGVKIGKGTTVFPMTVIEEDVRIGKNCSIGPFARIRKHVVLHDDVTIGNFVEVNRSVMANGAKAKHLTYLGDAFVGSKANIGAGTIVANYDGKEKHQTVIKEGAFIGSGSIIVAPVTVGSNAMTGAGSVVTRYHDVPDNAVVVGIPAKIFKRK